MNFRRAAADDLPRVLALYSGAVQCMKNAGIDQWDELYPDRMTLCEDIGKGEMYLLSGEDGPVSAVVLNSVQDPEYTAVDWKFPDLPVAVIHRLCVDAGAQGKGVGGSTLRRAEELLRQEGYRCIRLDAFPKNPAALKLYESNGYRLAGHVTWRKGIFNCYEKRMVKGEKE